MTKLVMDTTTTFKILNVLPGVMPVAGVALHRLAAYTVGRLINLPTTGRLEALLPVPPSTSSGPSRSKSPWRVSASCLGKTLASCKIKSCKPRQSLKTPAEVPWVPVPLPSSISPRPSKAKVSRSCVQFLTKPRSFILKAHIWSLHLIISSRRFTSRASQSKNNARAAQGASCIESHGGPAAEPPGPVCFCEAPPSKILGSIRSGLLGLAFRVWWTWY